MFFLNHHIGFAAEPAAAGGVFGTVFSATLSSDGTGYSTVTYRHTFAIAGLTAPSGTPTQARVRFKAHTTTEGCTINAAYIGHKGAGDPYDFAATPVQLTVSSATSWLIAAGASQLTDNVNFAWDKVSDIVVSMYIATGASDNLAFNGSVANYNGYSKAGSDAATVDATGYGDGGARLDGINLIETDGF